MLDSQEDREILVGKTIREVQGNTLFFTDGSKVTVCLGKKMVRSGHASHTVFCPKLKFEWSAGNWYVHLVKMIFKKE